MKIGILLLISINCFGANYFLSPSGSDSNNGTSLGTAWLSPNHAVNCGDILTAISGNYSASNFGSGAWGTVTCNAGNNVAWVKCITFDTCKIAITSGDGFHLYKSYWGVQGFEVDGSGNAGACFIAYADSGSFHHIIFTNNIANGCGANGFSSSQNGVTGIDYIEIIGNIVFNGAFGSVYCGSGISIYEPIASDSLQGTHIYVAGNFSYGTFDGNPCNGTTPTDGNGIIFDTFDGSQTGLTNYSQQAVIANNILIGNGGRGLEVFNNSNGTGPFAHIYLENNTIWGNNRDTNPTYPNYICGEELIYTVKNTESYNNLIATAAINGCNGGATPIYSVWVSNITGTTVKVYNNFLYSVGSTTIGTFSSSNFTSGPNNIIGNPNFSNPTIPGAPSCGTASNVVNCMTGVISNFTLTNSVAIGYGYQAPISGNVYDPLFPQWLCTAGIPAGLVTMGCQIAESIRISISGIMKK